MKLKLLKFTAAMALLFVFAVLTCNNSPLMTYRQVKEGLVSGKVNEFVQKAGDRNGAYLMVNDKKTLYFLLSRLHGEQEIMTYITDFVIKPVGDSLTISYKETNKGGVYAKKLDNNLLYRIKVQKQFKKIKVFKNGKETNFESVYL